MDLAIGQAGSATALRFGSGGAVKLPKTVIFEGVQHALAFGLAMAHNNQDYEPQNRDPHQPLGAHNRGRRPLGAIGVAGTCTARDTVAADTLLYTFRTSGTPIALVEVSPGLFWGLTANAPQIFSIDTTGTYNTIYTFQPGSGVQPTGLAPALNASVYGGFGSLGTTTIADLFAATLGGVVTLYPYNGVTQGAPNGVVQYPDNNLYSIFAANGTSVPVFTRVDYNGETTNLYTFPSSQGFPHTPFVGLDGNFYGLTLMNNTTQLGIYRLTSSGAFSWVVPSMPTGKYGDNNWLIALIQATNGKFYGTLPQGGNANAGTIYEANLSGQYKTIYEFHNEQLGIPETLMEASDGMIYGTARGLFGGGYTGYSSVFQVNPKTGKFKTIYNFTDALIAECECTLVQGTDGKLYGADFNGGTYVGGTIFVMDLGLPKPLPHVGNVIPQSGRVGQSILLFGDGFLGTTAVSFDGTPATTFTVPSHQGIWATVPSGATTGPITVTTPNGSFTTKISFTVQ